ncbi:MAG: hypothetical protein J6K64_08015 [Clostridia bacterium]|nr:hypothetical protein [Clostridia bacterium]
MEEWATETLKEVPFWRNDMTPEEYEIERAHFIHNWDAYTKGKYTPLWKQKNAERLYKCECPKLITDYPFFRDGMTCEQFAKEQVLFCEYMSNGGIEKDYIPSFER